MPDITTTPATAPGTSTEPAAAPGTSAERTFTQSEVDTIVGRRVARAMKDMPGADELSRFRAWEATQQTQQNTINTLTQERDTNAAALATAQAELEQMKRERVLLAKGVSAEDVEYYAFKIGKLVTKELTFEAAAEQFFAENKPRGTVRVNMTAPVGGGQGTKTENETMNALIRGFRG